jgi:hypothetical protein
MNKPSNAQLREALQMLERIGPSTPPETFISVYDSVLAASPDRDALAHLMFIAGMFLDRYPGVLELPRTIAEEFLASDDFDELLAGLKAIRHSTASSGEVVAHFLTVMKRNEWEVRCAGLFQLGQVVSENATDVAATTDQSVLNDLLAVLTDMAAKAPDDHLREHATRCRAAILGG